VGTIGELLERSAAVAPDDPYLYYRDEVWSWGRLDTEVTRTARALHDLGVRPGDRVAVLMRNRPEYLLAWLGAVRMGAVYVPVIADNKPPEVVHVLRNSGSKALIATGDLLEPLGDLAEECPELSLVLGVDAGDDALDFNALVAAAEASIPGPLPGEDDLAQIAFTSGTTNRPKGVVHTHHPYVRIGLEMSRRLEYTSADRIFVVLPLFHGNAQITSMMPSIAARAAAVLAPRFSGTNFWAEVQRYEPTEVNLLTGLQLMLLSRDEVEEEHDNSLQMVFGTTTESVERRFRERFGPPTVTTFSQTECSMGTMGDRHIPYRDEWVGWPLGEGNEAKIVDAEDPEDKELPRSEVGEIALRSSCVMQGYFNQPEETERALRNGWLHTGDRGYMDEAGQVYFKGRIKHVIRRSGENVSGEEVENTITSHPEVEECAAIAVPDDVREEEIKVFVVRVQGSRLSAEEIVDLCEDELANFKVPRYVEFRDSLPVTPRGTVKRFELAKEPNQTECWDRLEVGYRVDWRPEWRRGASG
jgi:acyl-CoA synthetase (AMP-forming)/AMP-acid ligase II